MARRKKPLTREERWLVAEPMLRQELSLCIETLTKHTHELREETQFRRSAVGDVGDSICDEEVTLAVRRIDDGKCAFIRKAIAHGDAGNYGLCILCEEEIEVKRLKAVSHAIQCIACASTQEERAMGVENVQSLYA